MLFVSCRVCVCAESSAVAHIRHNNLRRAECVCRGFQMKCNLIFISVGAMTASLLLLQIYLSQFSFQHVKILAFLLDQKGFPNCGYIHFLFEFHRRNETENKNREKID